MKLEDSIVLITSKDENNTAIGTAFIIHRDREINRTYLLTCFHVVEDVGKYDNVMADFIPATIIASDTKDGFDLAVLVVEESWDKPILKLSSLCEDDRPFFGSGYCLESKVPIMKDFSGIIHQKRRIQSRRLRKQTDGWELEIDSENPLQEGNSGSPVVDLLSKSVVGVVTTKMTTKRGGERGSAVSIEALKEIWSDMPADLISSDAKDISLSNLSNFLPEEVERIFPLSVPIVATAIILLGLSIVSLLGSYFWHSSVPWKLAYKGLFGWLIETLRSALLILEFLFLIRPYFSREIGEFFGFIRPKKENKKLVFSIRFIGIVMSASACLWLWNHHFDLGPQELAQRASCLVDREKIPKQYAPPLAEGHDYYYVPYQWYFLYSCITYIIIVFPTILMAIYSTAKDLLGLIKYKSVFVKNIAEISSIASGSNISEFLKGKLSALIEKNFEDFRENFIKILKRYAILFVVVSFIFSYELFFGHFTLSMSASVGIGVAGVVIVVGMIIIGFGYLHYEDAYSKGSNYIKNISPNSLEDFKSSNNSRSFFLQEIFREFLSLSIGMFLIILAAIIFLIVKLIFPDPCWEYKVILEQSFFRLQMLN